MDNYDLNNGQTGSDPNTSNNTNANTANQSTTYSANAGNTSANPYAANSNPYVQTPNPQQPYNQTPYTQNVTNVNGMNNQNGNYYETKKADGFAVASMILGILGFVTFLVFYLNIPLCILSIIFAFVSKHRTGKMSGMAIAGLVLSIIGLIIMGIIYAAAIAVISDPNTYKNIPELQSYENMFQ